MATAIASVGRIERITLGERVYVELRDLLIGGQLAPGERLPLRKVAEMLGVSIMPVREAVTRLVADEALRVLPNRAVSVPLMNRDQFREITTVRIAVEGFAAERAALDRTEFDFAAIRRFEKMFRAESQAERSNPDRAIRANKELHFAIYRAPRLPTLLGIIEGLWLKIGPVLNFDLKTSPDRLRNGGAASHHARLVDAIERKDGAAARQALVDDISGAAAFIESTGRLPG